MQRSIVKSRLFRLSLTALGAALSFDISAIDSDPEELDTVVVTATRTETPSRQVGSSVTVLTAEDIKERGIYSVDQILRIVPGLDVAQSGGPGRETSVFLRGANSGQTIVLIDWTEMNDPSSANAGFDFANLTVDNIERIEILRGAASSVYGSEAIGGVINIITKKGTGKPRLKASVDGGSYDTWRVMGDVAGGDPGLNYSLTASHREVRGFSAADQHFGATERDGYRNTTVSTRVGGKPADNLELGWSLRYDDGFTKLDNYDFLLRRPVDDPNFTGNTHELYTRGFGTLKLFDSLWEQTAGMAYTRVDRQYDNAANPGDPFPFRAAYLGEKIKGNWLNTLRPHETNTVSFGIDDEEDTMTIMEPSQFVKSYNTLGYFLEDQINPADWWSTTANVRHDHNNFVGGRTTWRVSQVWTTPHIETRLKANYGTGFKVPALAQLYDPLYNTGNPDLRPETSTNWDVGIEQPFWGLLRGNAGIVYFNNRFNNLIQFDPVTFRMENISNATAEGVETYVELNPLSGLDLRGTYTYMDSRDKDTGNPLYQRARDKGAFDLNYRFDNGANVHANIVMVGQRLSTGNRIAAGYVILNLAASYEVSDKLSLWTRVDNALNKWYEEVYGYGATGAAAYGGLTLTY
ncbi:TonB-dependent receptor [Methylococcus geothermalis]|uniref:TonB-dependent receptor n=1 Tax=Methylococcus geothermalis TaxID=2681310 RepID=A0A858Q7H5_9GAMM|nr:TonB-dependent receptor [Methylococcus geothermalis]